MQKPYSCFFPGQNVAQRDTGQYKMFKADFFREQIVASGVIRQICFLQQKPPDALIAGCVRAKSYSQTCCLRKLAIDRRCDINNQCDINNRYDIRTLFVIRNIISYWLDWCLAFFQNKYDSISCWKNYIMKQIYLFERIFLFFVSLQCMLVPIDISSRF